MPNTATMAIPTNRHATAPAAIMPTPTVEAPAWLITQRAILREAPDGDTAIRWQLAAALVYIASLEAQIQAAPRPAVPMRAAHWRPLILTLLQERGAPMAPAAITQALDAPRSLADLLRDMATAGLLIRTDGHYALAADPEAAEAPRRGGRPKKATP